jgi:hypothetical protein
MNINPEYQREVVWNDKRQTDLIDSFFNNYYVPPLIFKVVSGVKEGTNQRRKWRTCIDGKQRLTTIKRFFDGKIPYVDRQKRKWYYTDKFLERTGKSIRSVRLLTEDARVFIENVTVVNIEFEALSPEQEEDMFQRVQLGVPLTPAEKLAALSGPMPAFINDLRKTFTNFAQIVETKRSNDFKLVSQLVVMMYNRIEQEEDLKLRTGWAQIKGFLEPKQPEQILTPAFRSQVRRVLTKYNDLIALYPDIFTHSFGNPPSKMRKFSPVEFIGVGILIDVYTDRPSRVLAEDIRTFRAYLREHLHDLRTNTATWAFVMGFINRLEDARGYYEPERGSNKRPRTKVKNAPQETPKFNPPPQNQQQASHPHTVYNQQQMNAMQDRIAQQQIAQRDAFHRVPPLGGRAPDYAGGVKPRAEPNANGQKRTHNGLFVKREI